MASRDRRLDYSSGQNNYIVSSRFGLQYLHAERVLHHDLKPGNILLDRDFTAKVQISAQLVDTGTS